MSVVYRIVFDQYLDHEDLKAWLSDVEKYGVSVEGCHSYDAEKEDKIWT